MIPILCYFLICLVLAMIDWKIRIVPLYITVPSLILGCCLTGNVLPTLIMFAIGAILFKFKICGGGDSMIFAIMGAFLGYVALIALIVAYLMTLFFVKINKKERKSVWHKQIGKVKVNARTTKVFYVDRYLTIVPFVPFTLASSVLVIFGYKTIKFYL